MKKNTQSAHSTSTVRKLAGVGMLSAVASVLMFLDFPVPIMPSFIKMDVSELPALLASFAYGPVSGIVVCLIKNLINLMHTQTAGVGELCNFMLGVSFVLPAGLIYKKVKSRNGALLGAIVGAAAMALFSLPSNYYITYPIYANLFGGMDRIIGAYQAILPGVKNLFACLTIFNLPFTLVKGLLDSLICFLIYKPLSPVLHGRK